MDAVTAFAHSGVGQTDGEKRRHATAHIDLNFDQFGVKADDGTTHHFS